MSTKRIAGIIKRRRYDASFKKEFPEYIILDDDHIFDTHNNNIGNTPFFRTRRWSGLTNRDIRKIMKHAKER